jgi:hypothetical protein
MYLACLLLPLFLQYLSINQFFFPVSLLKPVSLICPFSISSLQPVSLPCLFLLLLLSGLLAIVFFFIFPVCFASPMSFSQTYSFSTFLYWSLKGLFLACYLPFPASNLSLSHLYVFLCPFSLLPEVGVIVIILGASETARKLWCQFWAEDPLDRNSWKISVTHKITKDRGIYISVF